MWRAGCDVARIYYMHMIELCDATRPVTKTEVVGVRIDIPCENTRLW